MMTKQINGETPSGKAVKVVATEDGGLVRLTAAVAHLDGFSTKPVQLDNPAKGATHYITVAGAGVGIDADFAERIHSAVAELKSAVSEVAPIEELRCERCHAKVDDTAYSQAERAFGAPCTAHYCAGCAGLLNSIGAGEHTAMDDRRESQTTDPDYKGDE